MEEQKESYTLQEFEEGVLAYNKYLMRHANYVHVLTHPALENCKKLIEGCKEDLIESVENCNKKIPKSLISKLGIIKIE